MLKIPKIPPKEELEFKEKELVLTVGDQFRAAKKVWFYLLAGAVVLFVPLKNLLVEKLSDAFTSRYIPPYVNLTPYSPQELRILPARILKISPGVFSMYAQVRNPNADLSVHELDYQFVVRRRGGEIVRRIPDQGYLLPGESKYMVIARLDLAEEPSGAQLLVNKVRWTIRIPSVEPRLEVQQKNSGTTAEENFFVEGLVKNLQGFRINKVDLLVLVFDRGQKNIVAINKTVLNELKPFENRYFRVTWPKGAAFAASDLGEIRVLPSLNPFEPEFGLEKTPVKSDR